MSYKITKGKENSNLHISVICDSVEENKNNSVTNESKREKHYTDLRDIVIPEMCDNSAAEKVVKAFDAYFDAIETYCRTRTRTRTRSRKHLLF